MQVLLILLKRQYVSHIIRVIDDLLIKQMSNLNVILCIHHAGHKSEKWVSRIDHILTEVDSLYKTEHFWHAFSPWFTSFCYSVWWECASWIFKVWNKVSQSYIWWFIFKNFFVRYWKCFIYFVYGRLYNFSNTFTELYMYLTYIVEMKGD